eukprot:COSAG06_NODE_5970_length_3178_cov_16.391686_3_plen_79_part_00
MTCAIALLMLSDFETLIEANMMTYILKLLLECEQSSRDSISSRCKQSQPPSARTCSSISVLLQGKVVQHPSALCGCHV